jgi:hypothetical protein
MDVGLLSSCKPVASGWESEVEIPGAKCPCDLRLRSVPTVDRNEKLIERRESARNSEEHRTIFQHSWDRAIARMPRTERGTSRVYGGMPDNPVGFVEDF